MISQLEPQMYKYQDTHGPNELKGYLGHNRGAVVSHAPGKEDQQLPQVRFQRLQAA